ncbi:MAG: PAS domain S-box protein [Rhodospirillales bacterium]|nr:PAS domain S-box protein [Rhodospirillales bacterium]
MPRPSTDDYRSWLFASLLVILAVSALSTGLTFALLWRTYVDEQQERLIGLARSQAQLIESVARFDRVFSDHAHPQGAYGATLSQVADAYRNYKGFGYSGEFLLGRKEGDQIVFLLGQRSFDPERPEPIAEGSPFGQPMRRALAGESGMLIGLDYRGVTVLAAYEPVPALDAGFVAKIDWAEIRAPFVRAGLAAGVGLILIFGLAGLVFRRISRPLLENRFMSKRLRQLSQAVEQSPNAIFITRLDGTIEYVNGRFTELTGYPAHEAVGATPRILRFGETPPDVYADLWRTILDGGVWRYEIKDRRKDGSHFWASALIAPVRDEAGAISHFVAMHEDITERKEAELQIRRAKEQAEVANRVKSELMANMSHELRTPLNAIIGFSEVMAGEVFGELSEKYREYVGDIHSSGKHLLDVINDILDVSAIEAGKIELSDEEVDLANAVDISIRLVAQRAEKGKVDLAAEQVAGLPPLRADGRRVKQILLNLLSNAVKFTPEGGRVTLRGGRAADGGILLTVADTGIGMTEAEIAIAFTQFGQVDSGLNRKHEGTGLGLPLTKGLVELHGGTLILESVKGRGTTATVRFPASRTVRVPAPA